MGLAGMEVLILFINIIDSYYWFILIIIIVVVVVCLLRCTLYDTAYEYRTRLGDGSMADGRWFAVWDFGWI